MINGETLYWLLSTIPQVLAALITVLSAFVFFSINKIEETLFRRANTIYKKWEVHCFDYYNEKIGCSRNDMKQAIEERSLNRIVDILRILFEKQNNESEKRKKLQPYQIEITKTIYNSFLKQSKNISKIKNKTINTAIVGFSTIMLSIIGLSMIEFYTKCFLLNTIIFLIILVFTAISIFKSFKIIRSSLIK
jgi:hypothetical protein